MFKIQRPPQKQNTKTNMKDFCIAFPASKKTKARAREAVQEYITYQEKQLETTNKLIERAQQLKEARRHQGCPIGVALSTVQIERLEIRWEELHRAINDLESLLQEIDASKFAINYEHKAAMIVRKAENVSTPTFAMSA
jgi:beta-phosphoglucomutase-like phosphatase (HAD superfamily)